jgi:hypothetical protein
MSVPYKDGIGIVHYTTNGGVQTLIDKPGEGAYIKLWGWHLHTTTNTTITAAIYESDLVSTSSIVAYIAVNNDDDTVVKIPEPISLNPDKALVLSGDASWTAHTTTGDFEYQIGYDQIQTFYSAPSDPVSEALEAPNGFELQSPVGAFLQPPNSVIAL